jgi:SAM-dependent methyltransferase
VTIAGGELRCDQGHTFPIVDGIPILINEANSIFSISDYTGRRVTTSKPASDLKRTLGRLLPGIDEYLKSSDNYRRYAALLRRRSPTPRVLVVGGRVLGAGQEVVLRVPGIELVETDVAFGPRTTLIADGHDLPFANETFDGAIVQAVLGNVVDPYRCVAEMHRVLKPQGVIYAETGFMQQVNAGPYDFTRWTHLGHRRLFRAFTEIDSGAVRGTGMALAWAGQYFYYSFVRAPWMRLAARLLARLTLFWLSWFDNLTIDWPGTLDGASGYYFLGQKSDMVLPDRELLKQYRGIL